MANDNTVTMVLEVDSKDAQKVINTFGASAIKSIKKVEDSVEGLGDKFKSVGSKIDSFSDSLKTPFIPIVAAIGLVTTAFSAVSRAIEEAAADSKQLKQLDAALRSTGEGGSDAVNAIIEYADAIKLSTGLSDDLVKEAFLTAKAFGTTTEEAKKLTSAAVDLATATGVDVETAVRQLGGTIDGSIGKIGNLGAEFRNLSNEQLKNGEAIDLVAAKYKGAAESGLNTFAGAASSLDNAISDLLKAFGKVITESPGIISAIQGIAKAINSTANYLGTFKPLQTQLDEFNAKNFINEIEIIGNQSIETAPKVKSLFDSLSGGQSSEQQFQTFGQSLDALSVKAVASTGLTGKAAEESRKKYDELAKSIINSGESEIAIATRIRDERLKILDQIVKDGTKSEEELTKARIKISADYQSAVQKQFDDVEKMVEEFTNTVEKEAKAAGKALAKIADLEKKGLIEANAAIKVRGNIIENFNAKRLKEAKETADKELDIVDKKVREENKILSDLIKDPFSALYAGDLGISFGKKIGTAIVGAAAYAIEGKQGAVKLVAAAAGGIFTSLFGPVIGGIVDSLTQFFTKPREEIKATIKEFLNSFPEIIKALAESGPAIAEALQEVLMRPSFWIEIGKSFGAVLQNVIVGGLFARNLLSAFGAELSNAFKEGAKIFTDKVQNAFLNMFFPGAKEIYDAIVRAVPAIIEGLQEAFSRLGNIFQGIIQFFADTFQPLIDAFDGLKSAIETLTEATGKGGGRGLIAEAGGSGGGRGIIAETLGLAKGGMVYAADGFVSRGTDTVPAMLTPGEMVIPVDLVGQLANFLAGQSSGGDGTKSDAILMAILQAVQQPVTVQSQVSVNQNAFADIILQLNRQNARLTA